MNVKERLPRLQGQALLQEVGRVSLTFSTKEDGVVFCSAALPILGGAAEGSTELNCGT
jgi:hypothetical protein